MEVRYQTVLSNAPKAIPRRRRDDLPGVRPDRVILSQQARVKIFLMLASSGALITGVSAALLQQHLVWEGGVGLLVSLLLFSRGFSYAGRRNRRRTDPKDVL